MPRAKGQRVHLTSFRRRGRDESRQRAPPGTEFCDFAWGDLVYENVRFSFTEPPLSHGNGSLQAASGSGPGGSVETQRTCRMCVCKGLRVHAVSHTFSFTYLL